MNILALNRTGEPWRADGPTWEDLAVKGAWKDLVDVISPGSRPTDLQIAALREGGLLSSRRHLIVSGPTNSGKSLVGYLALLEAVKSGKRALLLEPLRALAQEKFEELSTLAPRISAVLKRPVEVSISTGDYRLNDETMRSPPVDDGQIVIATPERVEAILRNPDFDPWIASFGAVCVDEAHLLGSVTRGPALDFVITSFLLQSPVPRVILLSATMGDLTRAKEWLKPCTFTTTSIRRPPLERQIVVLDEAETAEGFILQFAKGALSTTTNSLQVFVYQTASARTLAQKLGEELKELCGPSGALPYHARLPRGTRQKTREHFISGACRVLVCTSSLAAGVNLPTTHLVIRDVTYPGADNAKVPVGDLLQMAGRAGRGDKPGVAAFVVKPGDHWQGDELRAALENPALPALESPLFNGGIKADPEELLRSAARLVLSILARNPTRAQLPPELAKFVESSLAGSVAAGHVAEVVQWLADPSRMLAFTQTDGAVRATALGIAAARTSLPLEFVAVVGQLLRDLLCLEPAGSALGGFTELDHLLICELAAPQSFSIGRMNAKVIEQVDAWFERSRMKSGLFNSWIRGAEGFSKADQLLGSLGIALKAGREGAESARKQAYRAAWQAIVLWDRAQGTSLEDLSRRWNVDISGQEERWRDNRLFLLAGLAEVYDLRCFFFHLREDCGAGDDQVRVVKRQLQRMRAQTFHMMELVKRCSPYGPLLARFRSSGMKGIGDKTLEKLETLGADGMVTLRQMSVDQLRELGLAPKVARLLRSFLNRRT